MYRDFRDHNSVFDGVAARFATALNLSYNNRSERIHAELVSGTWFDTLGITTTMGRGLTPTTTCLPAAHPVVVLTHDYWKSRFNGSPGMLNQTRTPQRSPHDRGRCGRAGIPRLRPRRACRRPRAHHDESRNDAHLGRPRATGASLWLQLVGSLRAGVTARQAQEASCPTTTVSSSWRCRP